MLSKISILLTNHHLTLKDVSQSNSLIEKDLEDGSLTEQEVQELVDQFISKYNDKFFEENFE